MFDLIVQFLTQIGGGPGAAENNLVRFGLPAIFWAVLFVVAWSRQRSEHLPRERLLLFGFGLFFARELFMFLHTAERMLIGPVHESRAPYIEPFEHALAVSAILVISAAFIRYILDDTVLPRRYLLLGLTAVTSGIVISFFFWPVQQIARSPIHFHDTPGAWVMHLTKVTFVFAAIVILIKHKGWVRNVVLVALSFLLVSVLLTLINSLTGRAYDFVLCPISNNLHIWAVPIFGFVYFREQGIAKKKAEEDLAAYRGHLEQLVDERTAELTTANQQLELTAALEERQRIAAEMHDGLAQTISMLALRNDQAAQMVEGGRLTNALEELTETQEIISLAGRDLRRSIASLHEDPRPPCSLQDGLEKLLLSDFNSSEPQIHFHSEIITSLYLPARQMDQILKIAQEALLNARKHAAANRITIQLLPCSACYEIVVEDDGCGFDIDSVANRSGNHFGLSIMRARAQRIGGELAINSSPGSGTRIVLRWPNLPDSTIVDDAAEDSETADSLFKDLIGNREISLWQK